MIRRYLSPRFIGFFTRKTILLLVAFFVFISGGLPFLSPSDPLKTEDVAVSSSIPTEGALWTKTRDLTAEQNASAHFKKHGKDFGFQTEADYIQAVHNFIKNPPAGTIIIIQSDGDIVFYDSQKNWFAVTTKRGTPRTLFKPDPKIHGYPTNQDYVDAQRNK